MNYAVLGMVNQLGKFIPQLAEKDKFTFQRNHWFWREDQTEASKRRFTVYTSVRGL